MFQTEPVKKEFHVDAWPEVYASRQTRMVLRWPAVAVEEHSVRIRGESNESQTERVFCLAVQKHTVRGIIPLQESGIDLTDNKHRNRARLLNLVGQEVAFIVTGIDTENNTFLASRKAVMDALSRGAWRDLEPGMVKEAVARRLAFRRRNDAYVPSGFIVEIDGVEAFLPLWEISHGWVDEASDLIQPGDKFDVKIKSIDPEEERLVVSIKDLIPDPWPDAATRYQPGGYYRGVVTGVVRYGVFVELEPGVSALCRHMRGGTPKKGDVVLIVATDVSLNDGVGRIEGRTIRVIRKAS
jgi:small subunit ribosomal protein S1